MAQRRPVGGLRINGTTISVAVMLLGLAGTWGTFNWRMSQVERWQDKRETMDADIAVVKTKLEAIEMRLGSIDNSISKIGEREGRNTGSQQP